MSSAAAPHPLVDLLRQAIEERNLTQVEAAEQIDVAPRTLQYWLEGRKPRAKHRRDILAWLESEVAA